MPESAFDLTGPPLFMLRRCVIYAAPGSRIMSDSPEWGPIIRLQHNGHQDVWFVVANCEFHFLEGMPLGQVRIRPMLPSEIEDHDRKVRKHA